MKKNNAQNGPGRPKYEPVLPKGKFTFTDFEVANGVNPKTGKGKNCTTLTLRKWLKKDLAKRGHSVVTLLKDVLSDPNSKKGLGRKQFVYQKRVHSAAPASAKITEAPKKDVSKATKEYEKIKAELLTPTPVVSVAPVETPATPAPEVPTAEVNVAEPAPTTEPVATATPSPVETPVETQAAS